MDIQLVQQPANCPDLNVNDLGFFNSIESLTDRISPRTLNDLIRDVQEEFAAYDAPTLTIIFVYLQTCMTEVLNNSGGNGYIIPHLGKISLEEQNLLPTSIPCPALVYENALKAVAKALQAEEEAKQQEARKKEEAKQEEARKKAREEEKQEESRKKEEAKQEEARKKEEANQEEAQKKEEANKAREEAKQEEARKKEEAKKAREEEKQEEARKKEEAKIAREEASKSNQSSKRKRKEGNHVEGEQEEIPTTEPSTSKKRKQHKNKQAQAQVATSEVEASYGNLLTEFVASNQRNQAVTSQKF
jgi:hypothetical protein